MQAYPLHWPEGWPRTRRPTTLSRFRTSFVKARDDLLSELKLLRAKYPIISTNIPVRQDGLPYANYRKPTDCGVAVYFEYKGIQRCIACDRWQSVTNNLHAINLSIAAIRGMERWGATSIMDRTLNAFMALPDPNKTRPWREVLDCPGCQHYDDAKHQFKKLSMKHHPDRPTGNKEKFQELQNALKQAQDELL